MPTPFEVALSKERDALLTRRARLRHEADEDRERRSDTQRQALGELSLLRESIARLRGSAESSFALLKKLNKANNTGKSTVMFGFEEPKRHYDTDRFRSGTEFGHIEIASRFHLPPSEQFVGLEDYEEEFADPRWRRKSPKRRAAETQRYAELDETNPWGWNIRITNPLVKAARLIRVPVKATTSRDVKVILKPDPKPSLDEELELVGRDGEGNLTGLIGKVPPTEVGDPDEYEYRGPERIAANSDRTIAIASGIVIAHLAEVEVAGIH